MTHTTTVQAIGFVILAMASIFLSINVVHFTTSYTYSSEVTSVSGPYAGFPGSDYPRTISLHSDFVKIPFEETVHYDGDDSDAQDWNFGYPPGSGTFRYGPENRTLITSMFHQLHCVQVFGEGLLEIDLKQWGHIQHCLNYLREMALCRPDLTLEPGDFSERDFTVDRAGTTHICRDVGPTYSILASNWAEWNQYHKTLQDL